MISRFIAFLLFISIHAIGLIGSLVSSLFMASLALVIAIPAGLFVAALNLFGIIRTKVRSYR